MNMIEKTEKIVRLCAAHIKDSLIYSGKIMLVPTKGRACRGCCRLYAKRYRRKQSIKPINKQNIKKHRDKYTKSDKYIIGILKASGISEVNITSGLIQAKKESIEARRAAKEKINQALKCNN